ncbi:WbqC family protein [Labilibacter sediminis]|nr:WbqC family protein [Labilibacter sediminis]
MKSKKSIFALNYLPSIQYFAHWVNAGESIVEIHDNYLKRTYRNRCDILAANGAISLTVPVIKGKMLKTPTKNVEISYDTKWQALHWRSIVSAYSSSPFFEYYLDDFKPFYEKKFRFLLDYNTELMRLVLDALDYSVELNFTEEYMDANSDIADYRELIHPKKDFKTDDPAFNSISYRQVFSDKYGFTPNLSVIDLIFNKGPEALDILEDSITG